jgi:hypothetical protein
MKRLWIVPVVFVTLLVPAVVLAGSGEGSFDGVVRAIESRYHVHATRIPFMGLISLVADKATHEGVNRVRVAEIDDFSAQVDGDELNRIVTEKLGAGWERMIRETSRKGGEQTLIFAHPEAERMGLLIVDLDGSEMDLVEVSVDPRHLNEEIGHYEHHHDDESAGNESD